MDEKSLITAAQQGDASAFGTLYEQYAGRLYHYALWRLADTDDAQDAVQDCALQAWQSLSSLKHTEAFSAWLFRILYRCCCRKIAEQAKRRQHRDIADYAERLTDSNAFSGDTAVALKKALSRLSEKDREIVLLSVIGGLQSKELAALLHMTPAAVRQRLHRSLGKMKQELKE